MNSIAAQSYFGGPKPAKNSATEDHQAKTKDKVGSEVDEASNGGKWINLCIFRAILSSNFVSFRYNIVNALIFRF